MIFFLDTAAFLPFAPFAILARHALGFRVTVTAGEMRHYPCANTADQCASSYAIAEGLLRLWRGIRQRIVGKLALWRGFVFVGNPCDERAKPCAGEDKIPAGKQAGLVILVGHSMRVYSIVNQG